MGLQLSVTNHHHVVCAWLHWREGHPPAACLPAVLLAQLPYASPELPLHLLSCPGVRIHALRLPQQQPILQPAALDLLSPATTTLVPREPSQVKSSQL